MSKTLLNLIRELRDSIRVTSVFVLDDEKKKELNAIIDNMNRDRYAKANVLSVPLQKKLENFKKVLSKYDSNGHDKVAAIVEPYLTKQYTSNRALQIMRTLRDLGLVQNMHPNDLTNNPFQRFRLREMQQMHKNPDNYVNEIRTNKGVRRHFLNELSNIDKEILTGDIRSITRRSDFDLKNPLRANTLKNASARVARSPNFHRYVADHTYSVALTNAERTVYESLSNRDRAIFNMVAYTVIRERLSSDVDGTADVILTHYSRSWDQSLPREHRMRTQLQRVLGDERYR